MNKKLLTILIICLTVLTVKADDVVRIIQLQESGTLNAMLGESPDEIDSIVVSGPMNTNDWESLRQCCMYGRVRGIDMSGVNAENDSMPNKALGHMTYHSVLKNIRLPKTLRVIGPRAFKWCTSLEHVVFPENLKGIEWEAFYNCVNLRQIDLPATLESIGNAAFYYSGLEEVTVPEGLNEMGNEAFAGSIGLKVARIPARINNLGWGVFRGCWNLERADISTDTEVIPNRMFEDCESLINFEWPTSLQEIGNGAFEACYIKRIILPDNVRTINGNAFKYNKTLIVLGLPATLESFNQTALIGCGEHLRIVHCKASVPPSTVGNPYYQEDILNSIAKATLYVPIGCKDAYGTAPYWRSFSNIVEVDDSAFPTSITEQNSFVRHNTIRYGSDGRIRTISGGIYIENGKKNLEK